MRIAEDRQLASGQGLERLRSWKTRLAQLEAEIISDEAADPGDDVDMDIDSDSTDVRADDVEKTGP